MRLNIVLNSTSASCTWLGVGKDIKFEGDKNKHTFKTINVRSFERSKSKAVICCGQYLSTIQAKPHNGQALR